MSNVRGIVRFEAGEATLQLQFGINALVAVEEAMGVSVSEIGRVLSGENGKPVGVKDMRTLFRCGLIEHWPTGEPTDKDAGRIMDLIGLQRAGQLIGEAFASAFPDAVEETGGAPGKAKSGNATKK